MSVVLQGVTLIGNKENAAADPVGAFITANSTAMYEKYQEEQRQKEEQTPVNEGTSDSIYSNGSVGTNTSSYNYATSSLSKKERSYLSKMKDSNVPYFYEQDEVDSFANQAMSESEGGGDYDDSDLEE